jgi:hypothetical protein
VVDQGLKLRFDTYQHDLHFTKDFKEIKALETSQVKGFVLKDEDEKHKFIKIYPSINQYSPNFSYYEVLHDGKYEFYKLLYSTLELSNYMGLGSDGRTRVYFVDHNFEYLKKKDDIYYNKILYKKKILEDLFENDLTAYQNYIKENGKIKSAEDLLSFLRYLDKG